MKSTKSNFLLLLFALMITYSCFVFDFFTYKGIGEHKTFGVTYMTMNNPFYKVIDNQLSKTIEGNGDNLITYDPCLDVEKQIEQIDSFIEQDVDGIFITPVDSSALEEVLLKAKSKNIPVITIDAPIVHNNLVNTSISSNNYQAGVLCAEHLMDTKDSANILLLKQTDVKSAKDRIDGFVDTIKGHPNFKVLGEAECSGQLEIAMPITQDLLKEHPNTDTIIALNDPSALGAIAALEIEDFDEVSVYGIDGTPDTKALIGNSQYMTATVAQSPNSIGKVAANCMYSILDNKKIQKEIEIPVFLIDENNIDKYYRRGWE